MNDDRKQQTDSEHGAEQRRDALLVRLLKTPPQPRPKRDRGNAKSSQNGASSASGKNA